MFCHAWPGTIPQLGIMKWGTSLQLSWQKYAMEFLYSYTCKYTPGIPCPIKLPRLITVQGWPFWCMVFVEVKYKRAVFNVRVFSPSAWSNQHTSLQSTYTCHELEKKSQHEQETCQVELSSFTSLVSSYTGGMGKAAPALNEIILNVAREEGYMIKHHD